MKKSYSILFAFYIAQGYAQIISTIAGNGSQQTGNLGNGGPATSAEVWYPEDVCADNAGNIFIIDYGNGAIRKVDGAGIISNYAGGGTDNCPNAVSASQIRVGECFAVTCDSLNNLFVSDINSQIILINPNDVATKVVGNCTSTATYGGDGGPANAAEIYWPSGIAFDNAGNLFISDTYNNRIRKVNASTGIITTIAGTGTQGFGGDGGPATAAQFNYPGGVAVDALGNLFIADRNNHRIRMINTSGVITTVAGNGFAGYSGDGGFATSAMIHSPYDVAIDGANALYIADTQNNRIRRVNSSGIITTVAGNGVGGFNGDGGLATAAQLASPAGLAFDSFGNLYIADEANNRVRKVTGFASTNSYVKKDLDVLAYPNPANDKFFIEANTNHKWVMDLFDASGKLIVSKVCFGNESINTSDLLSGVYAVSVKTEDVTVTKKLIVFH